MNWLVAFLGLFYTNAILGALELSAQVHQFRSRKFPHAKLAKLAEILDVSRTEECERAAKYVGYNGEELRMQVEEVKRFYASLSMLRSRCIDRDDKSRFVFQGVSDARTKDSPSEVRFAMTAYLKHDQYQALGEILNELPRAMDVYCHQFNVSGDRYTNKFPRSFKAWKCNSTTTWTGRRSISYYWLLNICDSMSDNLESVLLGAEALLSILCETVPNFKVLWLKCLHALDYLCSTPVPWKIVQKTSLEQSLLYSWITSPRHWTPRIWFNSPEAWKTLFTHPATRIKGTIRLLRLHLVSSLFAENSTQLHGYLGGGVRAIYRDCTNMDPTRKELPMIIGDTEIKAQHDFGAEGGNFMDCDLASKLNLQLRNKKGDCKRFCMGNGKIVKALGRAKAVCAFAKEAQTKMKCWFYVFNELASPLIMGSQFLEKTKTLSDHFHRLEDCIPNPGIMPMVNLIGSTQHAKRRFTAHINHRLTLINADTGSDLDLMSSTYVRAHGYQLDRRRRCRKRVRFADNTVAETIGQVQATLTLGDGSKYLKVFDVLPNLTSEVLLGQFTLEEINAFTSHRDSFVDVFAGERYLELSVLVDLGKVSEFLARKLKSAHGRKGQMQKQGKSTLYDLKGLKIATNSWISIACETTG